MPSINLRLSDEEHDALRKWAFDSRRSLQKEIVWRLFGEDEKVIRSSAGFITPQEAIGLEQMSAPRQTKASMVTPAKRPRAHPCKHHFPPSKHCTFGCDD